MTLRSELHICFDTLRIWLEPVEGQPNVYTVGRNHPGLYPKVPATITLTTSTSLQLPDPRYLALHAACAKVVRMSGASESIDSILRGLEDTKVLSKDRSSVGLLETLLNGHAFA